MCNTHVPCPMGHPLTFPVKRITCLKPSDIIFYSIPITANGYFVIEVGGSSQDHHGSSNRIGPAWMVIPLTKRLVSGVMKGVK